MEAARELANLGAPHGATILAWSQDRGVGRAGRIWHSPAGKGLYCSILLRPEVAPYRLQPLAVAVGLAICDAIDPRHELGLQLKWPNDILAGDRKLAGILISSAIQQGLIDHAIVGIGVNLAFDSKRSESTIALDDIPGTSIRTAEPLLLQILQALEPRYDGLRSGDAHLALRGWRERLAYLGATVALADGPRRQTGIVRGIDLSGALLLDTAEGIQTIHAGELTRGPRPTC